MALEIPEVPVVARIQKHMSENTMKHFTVLQQETVHEIPEVLVVAPIQKQIMESSVNIPAVHASATCD